MRERSATHFAIFAVFLAAAMAMPFPTLALGILAGVLLLGITLLVWRLLSR